MELWMDKSALVHIEHHEKEEKNENQEQNLKEMKAEELLAEDNDGFVDICSDTCCCICFDNKIEEIIECHHSFCSDCLKKWFKEKNAKCCPLCRYSFENRSDKDIEKSSIHIIETSIVKESYEKNKKQIIEILDQYFNLPDFGFIHIC